MIKNPIYTPTGRAREYAELALNLYNGCPHGCVYCFARQLARKSPEQFADYKARDGILAALAEQLSKPYEVDKIRGKTVNLCFTCDPFPNVGGEYAKHAVVMNAIDMIHSRGAFVQILTKGNPPIGLWSSLGADDNFGVTLSCMNTLSSRTEPGALPPTSRMNLLAEAKSHGIPTFVSAEPVLDMDFIIEMIKMLDFVDEWKIGQLNYNPNLEAELRRDG